MALSYPEAFELSVELHRSSHRRCSKTRCSQNIFAKFTGKHLSRVPLVQVFPMNFAKLLRIPILKNICERLLLVAGWRATQKLNLRDLLLLPYLVYINISVGSSFFFFYLRFLYTYLFWLLKLNLQTENYMDNFGRF